MIDAFSEIQGNFIISKAKWLLCNLDELMKIFSTDRMCKLIGKNNERQNK